MQLEGELRNAYGPAEAGEPRIMSWVDPSTVDPTLVETVVKHAYALRVQLGFPRIEVRFFQPAAPGEGDFTAKAPPHDSELLAVTPNDMPYTIAIHSGLSGAMVPAIVAHEMRHVWQAVNALPMNETDCDRFAHDYMAGL